MAEGPQVVYVYANVESVATVLYPPTGAVELTRGQVWPADDPFVRARPDLFSSTPLVVESTTGRAAPPPTPVGKRTRPRRG